MTVDHQTTDPQGGMPRLKVGIPGFMEISRGGMPLGRTTLIAGTSGSGKTIFGVQFLTEAIMRGDGGGVLVTFEEEQSQIIANVRSLGWDLQALINQGKLRILDATLDPTVDQTFSGGFDLAGLMARIRASVEATGARRVVLDSLGSVFAQFEGGHYLRREVHRIATELRNMGVTSLITMERASEDGPIGRHGFEEFVADNVIVLRNQLENERRRRTIELLKFRGCDHQKGEFPFTMDALDGVNIVPLSSLELNHRSSNQRVTSGNQDVDAMSGGGIFRDSIVLVSGATGTGKTLMVTEFLKGHLQEPEQRALLFAFEESRDQLFRNAKSWGVDFEKFELEGRLKVIASYPEACSIEEHLQRMKRSIEAYKPTRVAVDSLSALERVTTVKSFREFVIGATGHLKAKEIATVFTNTTTTLLGSESVTESHFSTITDSIILLRYVELHSEMRRGITILKMRGSWHEKSIREFTIDNAGMHVGSRFRGVSGILSGQLSAGVLEEEDRLGSLFPEGGGSGQGGDPR